MSYIGIRGRWKKTAEGWQHVSNRNDTQVSNQYSNISIQVWECVLPYITSSKDLLNLAITCRSLNRLVENEFSWSYLIRTKFGDGLWQHYVRKIFHQQNNQQIDLHIDIERMTKNDIVLECDTISRTFLLNDLTDLIMSVTRAILRSYRYHLTTEISKQIVYTNPSQYIFRRVASFQNRHIEYFTEIRRQTVPLTKLIYFYLAKQRRVPVINFNMVYPREKLEEISDSTASIGRALQLSAYGRIIVLHHFHSILPGRYDIFYRLRFMSELITGSKLEFIAVPQYGLMTKEHTSSKQFADCLKKYKEAYFRRSMGVITVFKRCTVFVGCIDLTELWLRTTFVLDYFELIAVG